MRLLDDINVIFLENTHEQLVANLSTHFLHLVVNLRAHHVMPLSLLFLDDLGQST